MKKTVLGLTAATLVATPALASWKSDLFATLDLDRNGSLTATELSCADGRMFKYADTDRNGSLSAGEYFNSRNLLKLCK